MKIAKNVNRLGTEAVYSIFAKTKKLAKQGKKIIDLSLGQSDFKSPKHAVDATIQALKMVTMVTHYQMELLNVEKQ